MADSFKPDEKQDSFQADSAGDAISDTIHQYLQKINPVTMAQAMVHSAVHLPETIKQYGADNQRIGTAAIDAFKKGDYATGLRHSIDYLAQIVPGVGSVLDQAGNKVQSGDYRGAIADTGALATQIVAGKVGPKLLDAATEPGAASQAAGSVFNAGTRAAGAVAKAVTNPTVLQGTGAAVGGYIGHETGIPEGGLIGAYIGRKAGSALSNKLNAAPTSPLDEIPTVEAPTTSAPIDPTVEGLSQSLAGKSFSKLTPAMQEQVTAMAAKVRPVTTQPATPPAAPQPAVTVPPAPEPAVEPTTQTAAVPSVAPQAQNLSALSPEDKFQALRKSLVDKGILPEKGPLGGAPARARFDEGGPSVTVKPDKTVTLKNIPADSPLAKNLKALEAAKKLAAAMKE